MKYSFDVLIIGSGSAGLMTALNDQARALSNSDLAIAVAQIEALANRKAKPK